MQACVAQAPRACPSSRYWIALLESISLHLPHATMQYSSPGVHCTRWHYTCMRVSAWSSYARTPQWACPVRIGPMQYVRGIEKILYSVQLWQLQGSIAPAPYIRMRGFLLDRWFLFDIAVGAPQREKRNYTDTQVRAREQNVLPDCALHRSRSGGQRRAHIDGVQRRGSRQREDNCASERCLCYVQNLSL